MPNYHFTEEKIEQEISARPKVPIDRITVDSRKTGFDNAVYYVQGEEIFMIKNVGGSLVLHDPKQSGLNKLHVGNLILENPHIESIQEGEYGPRVDLNQLDLKIAQKRLETLEKRRNKDFLEELILKYAIFGTRYSVPHRLKELAASPQTLEKMIQWQQALVTNLEQIPDNTFLSQRNTSLEGHSVHLVGEIERNIQDYNKWSTQQETRKGQRAPKIIAAPEIFDKMLRLYDIFKESLHFIYEHDFLELSSPRIYWEKVDALGEQPFSGIDFVKYDARVLQHIDRHFPGSGIVGSKFTSTRFKNAAQVIDYAFEQLKSKGYNGEQTVLEMPFDQQVGLMSIMSKKDVPPGYEIKRDIRDGEHEVNVVSGLDMHPTNILTVIAGPIEDTDYHSFLTAFPGQNYPPIEGNEELWKNLVFIT